MSAALLLADELRRARQDVEQFRHRRRTPTNRTGRPLAPVAARPRRRTRGRRRPVVQVREGPDAITGRVPNDDRCPTCRTPGAIYSVRSVAPAGFITTHGCAACANTWARWIPQRPTPRRVLVGLRGRPGRHPRGQEPPASQLRGHLRRGPSGVRLRVFDNDSPEPRPFWFPPPCGQESREGGEMSQKPGKLYKCRQCGGMTARRQFCAPCRAERDRALKRRLYWLAVSRGERPPSNAARGYGAAHRRERERLKKVVEAGRVVCWRCGRWIAPAEPWDLGHDDVDRDVYRGAEHRSCNRKTSGRRKGRQVQVRIQSRVW
jgi:hypothetical protein